MNGWRYEERRQRVLHAHGHTSSESAACARVLHLVTFDLDEKSSDQSVAAGKKRREEAGVRGGSPEVQHPPPPPAPSSSCTHAHAHTSSLCAAAAANRCCLSDTDLIRRLSRLDGDKDCGHCRRDTFLSYCACARLWARTHERLWRILMHLYEGRTQDIVIMI